MFKFMREFSAILLEMGFEALKTDEYSRNIIN